MTNDYDQSGLRADPIEHDEVNACALLITLHDERIGRIKTPLHTTHRPMMDNYRSARVPSRHHWRPRTKRHVLAAEMMKNSIRNDDIHLRNGLPAPNRAFTPTQILVAKAIPPEIRLE